MFAVALDEVLEEEPVNEAILVELYVNARGEPEIQVSRYALPR
jgi:hypothetical protein